VGQRANDALTVRLRIEKFFKLILPPKRQSFPQKGFRIATDGARFRPKSPFRLLADIGQELSLRVARESPL
jgi:hypothetical protein